MSASATEAAAGVHGPWNPGIDSEPPWSLAPLSTIFRPENVFTGFHEAHELAHLTGLPVEDLVVFRPERLAVHEVLVRVTADLSVPDGPRVEDLGISFRRMTETILSRHVAPCMGEIVEKYEALRHRLSDVIEAELAATFAALAAAPAAAKGGGWLGFLRRPARAAAASREDDQWTREERAIQAWAAEAQSSEDPLRRAACRALVRVASAVSARHGRLWGDQRLLAPIAVGIACNDYGAEAVGRLVDPCIRAAAMQEGYRLLPAQAEPVVMNTKGASASGKSTMRPLQRALASEIGARWDDFALISPDIWRKYLLDYGSLSAAYKYAGAFTSRELAAVDQKLDRYMARKAEHGEMSHLLIDRFRFDSFAPDSDEPGSNLLTRFGRFAYLFFMITPPHETVARAWGRGLEVGRYKAVDDLLAHNVEAYTGMPELFFTWALQPEKAVHCEFLDNSVPYGDRPRTVAFGWNGELNVLDVKALLDIDRYRKIRIDASGPEDVYPRGHAMAAASSSAFLAHCARRVPVVNFADRDTGRVYARLEGGKLAWTDAEALGEAVREAETRAGLLAVVPDALSDRAVGAKRAAEVLRRERFPTIGHWGASGR